MNFLLWWSGECFPLYCCCCSGSFFRSDHYHYIDYYATVGRWQIKMTPLSTALPNSRPLSHFLAKILGRIYNLTCVFVCACYEVTYSPWQALSILSPYATFIWDLNLCVISIWRAHTPWIHMDPHGQAVCNCACLLAEGITLIEEIIVVRSPKRGPKSILSCLRYCCSLIK